MRKRVNVTEIKVVCTVFRSRLLIGSAACLMPISFAYGTNVVCPTAWHDVVGRDATNDAQTCIQNYIDKSGNTKESIQ